MALVLFPLAPASAHGPYNTFGATEWYSRNQSPYDTFLEMRCDDSIPGTNCQSGFANQVYQGFANWTYLAPPQAPASMVMSVLITGEASLTWGTCYGATSSDGRVSIFRGGIAGAAVATTGDCANGNGDIYASSVKFQDSSPWSTDPSPTNSQLDTQSFATHEFGHVSGVFYFQSGTPSLDCRGGHWDSKDTNMYANCTKAEASLCDGGANDHTMCAGIPTGTTSRRTPESHDEHTYQVIYGT